MNAHCACGSEGRQEISDSDIVPKKRRNDRPSNTSFEIEVKTREENCKLPYFKFTTQRNGR
jgi:hypothetical protein